MNWTQDPRTIALRDAVDAFDAATIDCPARKKCLGDAPCPRCRATSRDGCGAEIDAAYLLVGKVRDLLDTVGGA